MRNSKTFSISINRPVDEVYEFLLDPTNFLKWVFIGHGRMRHLKDRDWEVETTVGRRVLRFAERMPLGVLDHYALLSENAEPHPIPMRVVANGEGTELIYTSFQRDGQSDEQWSSMLEWVTTDLMTLKTLLEAHAE